MWRNIIIRWVQSAISSPLGGYHTTFFTHLKNITITYFNPFKMAYGDYFKKMSDCQTKAGNQEYLNVWMFWTTFVFMCKLKSDCLTCYLSHVTFHISHVKCQGSKAYFDHWYMLNNFGFHVYAQKSLIISEIGNLYFLTSASASPSLVTLQFIELVPS